MWYGSCKRFEEATAYASVNVTSLEPHKFYPILRANGISIKYGPTMVLTIRISEASVVQVFLPKRYSDVMSDADMDSIDSKAVALHLVLRGFVRARSPTCWLLNLKYTPHADMRPKGKHFEVSDSLYATQRGLEKNNIVGQALWLMHFTPAKLDHLGFVNRLLKTFCELDICCDLIETYPANIAGVLSSHYVDCIR